MGQATVPASDTAEPTSAGGVREVWVLVAESKSPAEARPSDAQQAAMDAFYDEQRPYADLSVPTNVSYTADPLPFGYVSPVTGCLSSGFGYRLHPLEDVVKFHYGTDFAADSGDDILCFADGTVTCVADSEGYGNYLRVDHGDGYITLYGHCGRIFVREGQGVSAGDRIALVGATGQVTGPHLHFELMRHGSYLNPEFYLAEP